MNSPEPIKAKNLEFSKDLTIVLFLALTAAIVLSIFINSPFKESDHDGAAGCHWGTIARNYIRYGWVPTKLGMVENGGLLKVSEFRYYTHHPPLNPIILSLGLRITGVHEWSIRLIYIIFAIGVLILFYFLSKELWNREVAILSCLFMLITPMYLHFSSVSDMTSITLFLSLATVYAYARWLKTNSRSAIFMMSTMLLLANFSGWEAYYLIPAILVHNFLRDKKRIVSFLIPCLGVATFSIYLIHSLALGGLSQLMDTYRAAGWRSGTSILLRDPLFFLAYMQQIFVWIWILFTPFLVISIPLFFYIYMRCGKEERYKNNYDFALLFLIFGLLDYLIFIELCYKHPYLLYNLIPFFVLSSSLAISHILQSIKQIKTKLILIFLLSGSIIFTFSRITKPVFLMLHNNDDRRSFALSGYKFRNDDSHNTQYYNKLKAYVQAKLGPTDIVLTNTWHPHLRFYLDINTNERIKSVKQLQEVLNNIGAERKKAMMIYNNGIDKSSNEIKLLEYLEKNFGLSESFVEQDLLIFDLSR